MSAATKSTDFARVLFGESAFVAGAVTAAVFFAIGDRLLTGLDNPLWFGLVLFWQFAVMVWCAFRVVHHADALAELLGEPYGTLILTISVVSIEVTIIATMMLTGSPNPTLPRDTMFAILMIVLNGMIGLSLAVGALRHTQQHYNLEGAIAYLAVISSLAVIALVIPEFTHSTFKPMFTPTQAAVFGLLTALLYGVFLIIQTTRHRDFFKDSKNDTESPLLTELYPRRENSPVSHSLLVHVVLLFATLLPIILLSKPLGLVLDYGIEQQGMPTALGAIFIAILILSPEGVAAVQAAYAYHLQRAVNLSLGSALSTIGLTVPVVLTIGILADIPLEFGLSYIEIVLLALTLFVCRMTFSGAPTNVLLGFVHLVLFFTFIVLIFEP